jgi:hypothetical protein
VDCFLEEKERNTLRVSDVPKQTSNSFSLIVSGFRLPAYDPNAGFSFKVVFDVDVIDDPYEEGIAFSIADDMNYASN